ncbi:helix-turn-helix transcriptional regulator [Streptosporangium saharense]|uniref:helix-turn-helix transcriptional regulator n=1 Tax=Streptosporangium saharense TaxID=1706840 RepID=UPI003324FB22
MLRLLMEQRGETCATIGPAIGRSKQLVAHLAYGRRETCNAETAERLAAVFDVDVADLFWPRVSDESSKE